MPVHLISEDSQFSTELNNAGNKLTIVDFTASWCGPCQRIISVYEELSSKYSKAVFLKIDVDQCPDTAAAQGVTAMPTFIFFKNKTKVDMQRGADPTALEEKIKKWYTSEETEADGTIVPGHIDLISMIDKGGCECLNESDEHPFVSCLQSSTGFLESDCDEQLIISIDFNQPVKLHSMKIKAPDDKGPKTIKLFINQPRTLDFDQADAMEPVQLLELTPKELSESLAQLRYVKLQNVTNLQLFVKDNQKGTETTQIDYLAIYGSPINITNMGDFKRVAGKKGESH